MTDNRRNALAEEALTALWLIVFLLCQPLEGGGATVVGYLAAVMAFAGLVETVRYTWRNHKQEKEDVLVSHSNHL